MSCTIWSGPLLLIHFTTAVFLAPWHNLYLLLEIGLEALRSHEYLIHVTSNGADEAELVKWSLSHVPQSLARPFLFLFVKVHAYPTIKFLATPISMASHSGLQNLSSRGKTAARSSLPVFLDVISDSFSAGSNPAGFISLGLAENVRMKYFHCF
jgi:hypothetical protein